MLNNSTSHDTAEETSEKTPKKARFIRKETYSVEETPEWDHSSTSRFNHRVPKQIHRTVITVSQRELIVERSGLFFKVMGHLSNFVLILFTAAMVGVAVTLVVMTARMSGVL